MAATSIRTARNGSHPRAVAVIPRTSAATAIPFEAGAARSGIDEAAATGGDVGRPGGAVVVAVLEAAGRVVVPAGDAHSMHLRLVEARLRSHGAALYGRRPNHPGGRSPAARRLPGRGARPDPSRPARMGARRAQRRRPAADRPRSAPGRGAGGDDGRREVRRGAGLADDAGPPDGGARARGARAGRGRRRLAGGDPRPEVARHPGRAGGGGLQGAARADGAGSLGGVAGRRVDPRVRRPHPPRRRSTSWPSGASAGSSTSCRCGRSPSPAPASR